jgi:ribonuclease P protein component
VSRQVGKAVERNRVRRRLREIVRLADAGKLHAGHDYVLIGRRAVLDARFGEMVRELDAALNRIHAIEGERTGGAAQRHLHDAGQKASKRATSRSRRRIPPMSEL